MREETIVLLSKELDRNDYGLTSQEYTLQRLFELYLQSEVKTIEDVFVGTEDFENFVLQNRDKFKYSFLSEFDEMLFCMTHSYNFAVSVIRMNKKQQKQFADTVGLVLPDSKMSILDVGATGIPYSSYLLAKKYRKVTSIDKTSNNIPYHDNLNVEFINNYLTFSTDISSYDALVGRRPCEAIPIIVERSAKKKKPYFIDLCNCWADGKSYYQLIRYLREKDKKLRVAYRNPNAVKEGNLTVYVHNLGLSDSEIQDAIYSTEMI